MNHKAFLTELGLESLLEQSEALRAGVNAKLLQSAPYPPELSDLESLHQLIQRTNRTTVLEFGCGWSSMIFAASLKVVQQKCGDLGHYRRNNAYECHSIDDQKEFFEIAKARISPELENHIVFYFSPVNMTLWNGRVSTEYNILPLVSPDLIYLDGPDQFGVAGDINGWSTRHKDMMPMACEHIKIEHLLTPNTIIIVDGRAANARFLKCNFQRNWDYKYCPSRDQHFFLLDEEPLGKYSKALISEVYFQDGKWGIDDI